MPRRKVPWGQGAWEQGEKGWYHHPNYGGVSKETSQSIQGRAGWYWWPLDEDVHIGPFKTLNDAQQVARRFRTAVAAQKAQIEALLAATQPDLLDDSCSTSMQVVSEPDWIDALCPKENVT